MITVPKSRKRSTKPMIALALAIAMILSCLPTAIAADLGEAALDIVTDMPEQNEAPLEDDGDIPAQDEALPEDNEDAPADGDSENIPDDEVLFEDNEDVPADEEAPLDTVAAAELQTIAADLADEEFLPNPQYPWQDHRLPADERIEDIMSRLTTDEKIYGTTTSTRLNLTNGQTGGGESLHGVATGGHATIFPAPFGMSQTWNRDLLYSMGEATAMERLANGITSAANWAPILDTIVDPRSGRAVERMGEDSYLIGSLGFEMAQGFNQRNEQGYQMAYGMLKHFMAYGPQVNRLWIPTVTTQRTLREYFIPSWYYTIAGGASKEYMNSYPVVNGRPMSVNPLQGESLRYWTPNFPETGHNEHTTMNDYGSGSSVFVHSQRFLPDNVMGRALGMAMGIQNFQRSWSFRDYGGYTGNQYETVARGMATPDDFADYSRRVLTNRLRFGYLDQLAMQSEYLKDPIGRYGTSRADGTGRQDGESLISKNRELTFKLSQEQIVMLKNDDHYLPLKGGETGEAVVLGSLADLILKNWYTGQYAYKITLKDALINKLGADNVYFNNAVDSVAIKHDASDKYLQGGTSTAVSNAGAFANNSAVVTVDADAKAASVDDQSPANRTIFEVYDYGSDYKLLRTAANGLYVQVRGVNSTSQINPQRIMYNNTITPGVRSVNEINGGGSYSNYQSMRLARTEAKEPGAEGLEGKYGIYHTLSGNGLNGGMALAYDVDDEDINRGSYLTVGMEEEPAAGDPFADYKRATYQRVTPDIVGTNGPWMTEYGVETPVDTIPNDEIVDNLPASHIFTLENIQSAEQAAKAQIDKVDPDAPIILVVGYEPHLNAREAFDLLETGLSEQQMRLIDYVTGELDREVILIVKTNNPMAIDRSVQDNPNVKSILTIAHHGQEEGSALVSVLFDDGYKVPAEGWAPADSGIYQVRNTTPPTTSHQPYDAYPGYLPPGGVIPAASPAGRLSATWYDGVDQMIGASENHPPSSFVYPAFDEETNNNLSSMNGTMPTGILTHDIINGERTYMYLGAGRNDEELAALGLDDKKTGGIEPLYAFGYGLSYGDFTYSDVTVSGITEGPTGTVHIDDTDGRGIGPVFTVSGKVTNSSEASVSDEVVQIYATFDGPPSRIQHPLKKLIGYTRLKNIEPGATKSFSMTIDVVDKLGVFDVEIGETIVEPGDYIIKAVGSSDAALADGNNATLSIAEGEFSWINLTNTGIKGRSTPTAAAVRDLSKVTYAENFDDYSLRADGSPESIEPIATTIETDSGNSVKFRGEGTWIVFKDVGISGNHDSLTVSAGADRAGSLDVYLAPAGAGIPDFESVPANASFSLTDTRIGMSDRGAVNLGIGQVGIPATATERGYAVLPGDSVGRQYNDNYIRPDLKIMNTFVDADGGRYDVYVRSENFGTVLEWIKFGASPDTADNVVIDSLYRADYIREPGGSLQLRAKTDPISAVDEIFWSVDDESVATIDENGLLTAAGENNGEVVVTASAGGAAGEYTVYVTNQLESNKVEISTGEMRSVDHLIMRNGSGNNAFSVGDLISTYQGSVTIGLATSPFLSESGPTFTPPAGSQNGQHGPYIPPNNFLTIPQDQAEWTITDLDGTPTELATVSEEGVVEAAGTDNGNVLVTATLTANPDIFATKEIFIVGQAGSMDPYKMIHFGDYNEQTSITAKTATHSHANRQTNEIGYYISNPRSGDRATMTFRSIGFTYGADTMYIRAASAEGGLLEVYCDGEQLYNITIPDNPGDAAVTGNASKPGNIEYRTFVVAGIDIPEGDHEIVFALTDGYVRLNWFQFEGNLAIDQDAMDIGLENNSDLLNGDSVEPEISITSKAALTAFAVVAAYDTDGKLVDAGAGEKIDIAADEEEILTASLQKNPKAASYRVFVWTGGYKPLTFPLTFEAPPEPEEAPQEE